MEGKNAWCGLDRPDRFEEDVDRGALLALLRECSADETLAAPELAPRAAVFDANFCLLVTRVASYDLKRAA